MDERVNKNTYKLNEGKRNIDSVHMNMKRADYFDKLSVSKKNNRAIKGIFGVVFDKLKAYFSVFNKKDAIIDDGEDEFDAIVLTKLEYRLLIGSVIALIGVSVVLLCVIINTYL